MRCPKCGHEKSQRLFSSENNDAIRGRREKCMSSQVSFTTYELAEIPIGKRRLRAFW